MTISSQLRILLSTTALAFLGVLGLGAPAAAFEVPESAYGNGAIHEGDANVESRLVVDATEVAPGDTLTVGIAFTMNTDWHIYWEHPGDAGVPTNIEWQSEQLEFGPLQWASPKVFHEMDGQMTVYGYGNEVLLFSEATVKEDASGVIELGANVDYLACSNLCMPGHSQLSREIPVGEETVRVDEAVLSVFSQWGERVPRKAEDLGLEATFHYSQDAIRADDEFEVLIELVECRENTDDCQRLALVDDEIEHTLIPDAFSIPEIAVTRVEPHPEAVSGWLIQMRGQVAQRDIDSKDLIAGVLELKTQDGDTIPVYLRDEYKSAAADSDVAKTPLPFVQPSEDAGAPPTKGASLQSNNQADGEGSLSLGWVLLLSFIGGMILNLMPCVFPVLALKVSSFATIVHESRRGILTHGAAYTGGIVASMFVLAGVVIGLRFGGTQVGWGFQFQQPHFLAALVVILVLFALNLFGVFEVTMNAQNIHDKAQASSGVKRSVWEGVLAVILATPCSAPFLGTAVGFALSSGPLTIIAVFFTLGLGLAAPMIVLTLMPGWAKLLPRPGMWMEHLKTTLGFALLGSAIWIFWLLGRQVGVDSMGAVLSFIAVLGLAAWIFGLVQFNQWSRRKVISLALAAALIGAAGYVVFPLEVAPKEGRAANKSDAAGGDSIDWQDWSDEAVAEALAEGRPVFVDFGADWCLTCKVNEKNAIETQAVRDAAAKYNVAMLYADWTNPDEDIRLKLAEYGKAGVPFYLVYSPQNTERGKPLPEVLTADMLVKAFAEAAE